MISSNTMPAPTQQAQLLDKRESPKALKRKNVSWPAKDMLHQMRLFAVDDAPFVIGVSIKDHQSSSGQDSLPKNDLFTVSAKRAKLNDGTKRFMAMQPQKKWQCPSKIVYDPQWQVTNCSESTEVKKQLQRESRLLEVVYPRNIVPLSPAEPQEVNVEDIDDSQVYEIPLLPVEEDKEPNPLNESAGEGVKGGIPAYCNNKQEEICSPDGGCDNSDMKKVRETVEDEAVGGGGGELFLLQSLNNGDAEAAAAIAHAAKGLQNGGDMIDFNLLQELLSNPEMVQALTHSSSDRDASGNSIDQVIGRLLKTGPPKTSSLPAATSNSPVSTVEGVGMGSFGPVGGTPINMPNNNNQPPVFHAFHRAPSHVGPPPTQDYYKELIHQHGATRGAISSSVESRAFQPPLPMFAPVSSFMPTGTITTTMTSTTFIPPPFSTAQAPITRLPSSNSSSSNSYSYSNSSALQMPLSPHYPPPRPLLFAPPMQAGPGLTYTRDDNFHNWSCNLNRERALISDYEFGRWQGNDTIANTTAFGPPTPMCQDGRGGGSLEIDIGRMKSHRSCVHFNTLNGCRFGEKCDFTHQPPIVSKQEPFQCSRGIPPHYPPPLPHHHHHHHPRNLAASGKVLKETR